MVPALWPGETALVETTCAENVRLGDVVVYESAGYLIAHRIVGQTAGPDGDIWVTRGDARRECDAPIRSNDLLGVVTSVRRLGRDRPVPRRLSPVARGLGWLVPRSALAHRVLCRLGSIFLAVCERLTRARA
jgi:hypothetical protein